MNILTPTTCVITLLIGHKKLKILEDDHFPHYSHYQFIRPDEEIIRYLGRNRVSRYKVDNVDKFLQSSSNENTLEIVN